MANSKRAEGSSGSSISKKEENDRMLFLWQRAAFMDSGKGVPKEMADSLRLRVAMLGSYHTKMRECNRDSFGTEQLLKDYLDRYARVMDERNESKGMDNFSDIVHTLLAGRAKVDRRGWKSSLELAQVKKLPQYQALLQEAEKYSDNLPTLDRSIPFPSAIATPTHSETPSTSSGSTSSVASPPSHTPSCNTATGNKEPQVTGSWKKSERRSFQYAQSIGENRGHKSAVGGLKGSESTGGFRGQSSAAMGGSRGQSCGFSGYGASQHPPSKRSRSDLDSRVMTEGESSSEPTIQPFSTARDEYARQQQWKFGGAGQGGGGGGTSAFTYGSSKKVLGTRRGAGSRFVPPVRKNPEMEADSGSSATASYSSEAEIRSRVLRGPGGGGGGGGGKGLPPELEGNERLKNIEPRMVELIMNEIMDHSAPVGWDDIAGLEFAKATIKEIVVWPMMRPDLFTGLRGPPKGILLFGPPGTGKTLIGKCIASQVEATFFSISASSLTSKWIGEGEKMVRALFAVARCFQPAVIFMDEIDSLLTQRSDTEHESSRRIKTEFLVQLDGATTSETDRLLVIGATNRPQEIDEAARRRLVKRLYIPLPDAAARRQIVLNLMRQQPYHLADQELDLVCNRTEGYSGADMANLCREAAYGPVREAASSIQHISASEMRQVLCRDFESALLVVKPSVSEKDLDLYIEWNRQFGCGGK